MVLIQSDSMDQLEYSLASPMYRTRARYAVFGCRLNPKALISYACLWLPRELNVVLAWKYELLKVRPSVFICFLVLHFQRAGRRLLAGERALARFSSGRPTQPERLR